MPTQRAPAQQVTKGQAKKKEGGADDTTAAAAAKEEEASKVMYMSLPNRVSQKKKNTSHYISAILTVCKRAIS